MTKGNLWYNPEDGTVGVVRSFGWYRRDLQAGQPIAYQIQPDLDHPETFRWEKTTLEKEGDEWYLAGTNLRGTELNGTIIDIDEL